MFKNSCQAVGHRRDSRIFVKKKSIMCTQTLKLCIGARIKVPKNCHFYSLFTWEGTFLGGSILMEGSHSPGGNTVT